MARDCLQDYGWSHQDEPLPEQGWTHRFREEARDCQEGEAPGQGWFWNQEGEVRVC